MKIVWGDAARADMAEIVEHISEDNAAAARSVTKKVTATAMLLKKMPYVGRPGRVVGTREIIVSGTPYILPYKVYEGHIDILRVYHSARRWPEQLED